MIENTPAERVMIAAEAVASFGDAFVIETEEELVKVYREYARRDLLQRSNADNLSEEFQMGLEEMSEYYAKMSAEMLAHDLPALTFLFKRFLREN